MGSILLVLKFHAQRELVFPRTAFAVKINEFEFNLQRSMLTPSNHELVRYVVLPRAVIVLPLSWHSPRL